MFVPRLARWFDGHPDRIVGAALVGAIALALFWYLASPLWIRTQRAEDAPTAATTLLRGELRRVDGVHHGTGPVLVLRSGTRLLVRFESVSIANGPDLHVYLSKDAGGTYREANAVYLGPLKATDGSFNYDVPAGVDLAQYRSVVVWCRNFATLFTWADLAP